jgi:hypothetical protein
MSLQRGPSFFVANYYNNELCLHVAADTNVGVICEQQQKNPRLGITDRPTAQSLLSR